MTTAPTLLQQVVLPVVHDPDVLPLYVDAESWTSVPGGDGDAIPVRLSDGGALGAIRGRRGFEVAPRRRVSFGTYFNAFPTSYWARWTRLTGVRLTVTTTGAGQVLVCRSNARGAAQRVESATVDGMTTTIFDLPFTQFGDGGWYWFDLVAEDDQFRLDDASWHARDDEASPVTGSVSLAITTINRAEYVLPLLDALAADEAVLELVDRIYVVDQGTQKVRGAPGYAAIESALGGRLSVIEQDNLGGSGGFSRGMHETLAAGESSSVLLLDDDVALEPESIRRLLRFADHSRTPTIVGGHMFDLHDKSRLHAFAEGFDLSSFIWESISPRRHDFAVANLRQTRWLHRRLDAQFNGWWMCLIPVSTLREIGLSLPVFIKWDDAEYGLRAAEHGIPTVSLPGAALWHVSWVDKNDTVDWQAFYHARNRLVTALLHSPVPHGGRLLRASFEFDMKYLFSMQYFAMAARLDAYRSVLDGPDGLHAELRDRLGRVRSLLDVHPDGRAMPLDRAEEAVRVRSAVEEARAHPTEAPHGRAMAMWLARSFARNVLRPARRDDSTAPAHRLAFEDARWWVVPRYDSVAVTNAEGSGALWYRRDRPTFMRMFRESWRLRRRIRRAWPRLAREYRQALPDLVSDDRWTQTFAAPAASDPR